MLNDALTSQQISSLTMQMQRTRTPVGMVILLLFCLLFFPGYVPWKSRWCCLHVGNETAEASHLPHMIRRERTTGAWE